MLKRKGKRQQKKKSVDKNSNLTKMLMKSSYLEELRAPFCRESVVWIVLLTVKA